MQLLIMSLWDAINYTPTTRTYAIRIWSGYNSQRDREHFPLVQSPNYLHVAEYTFDDMWPGMPRTVKEGVMIDRSIAAAMLRDFEDYLADSESLLVHCLAAKNRSPAVGLAFNDVFDLGHDEREPASKYPGLNRYVFDTIVQTGRKLRIGRYEK